MHLTLFKGHLIYGIFVIEACYEVLPKSKDSAAFWILLLRHKHSFKSGIFKWEHLEDTKAARKGLSSVSGQKHKTACCRRPSCLKTELLALTHCFLRCTCTWPGVGSAPLFPVQSHMQKTEKILIFEVRSCREISYVHIQTCFPLLVDLFTLEQPLSKNPERF